MQKLQQAPGASLGRGCLIVFALFWTGFSCLFCAAPLAGGLATLASGNIGPAEILNMLIPSIFSLPFLAIGIGLLVWAVMPLIARTRVSAPDIAISSASLRAGEEFTLTYQQLFKGNVEVKRIAYQLIFRETAIYRRGTDTVTVHHENVIEEIEIPGRQFQAGESFNDLKRLHIPNEAMHTFVANRNKLQWFIKAKVEMAGWPDFNEEYPLVVAAERV